MRFIAATLSVLAAATLAAPTADAHPRRYPHRHPHKVCKVVHYKHHTKRVCRWVR